MHIVLESGRAARALAAGGAVGCAVVVSACAGGGEGAAGGVMRGGEAAAFPMLVDGRPVGWDVLTPLLAEAAGAEVTREVALDLILDGQLRARGIDPASIDAAAERRSLLASIAAEAPDAARQETVDAIRRARGLGERRMARLAWRTAALRVLVADRVSVTEDERTLARELRSGTRVSGRIAVLPTAERAAALRGVLEALPDGAARAARLAATAGSGVLEEVSPSDPTLSDPVRSVLRGTAIGEPSPVVPVPGGYAVVLIERRGAAPGPGLDDAALTAELLRRKQRLAMDRLAEDLLAQSDVRVLDAGLGFGVD